MTLSIPHFFEGQNIFITGASGFMGKIFSRIDTTSWLKVRAISGDVASVGLGLDELSRTELVSNVTVIFHMAASVRFDEPFKSAVLLNTRGTREMVNLARDMMKLKTLVHVSTAYCILMQQVIEEKVYPAPANPHKIIQMVENLQEFELNNISKRILGNFPNTYVFTKALSESIIYEARNELPVVIFRPSIVCPAMKEPFPGWADSNLGPMGMLVGAGSGLVRSAHAYGDMTGDLLPVDFCINAMIATAWTSTYPSSPLVVNCTTSNEAPITMNQFLELGKKSYAKFPHEKAFWYPGGGIQDSKFKFLILFVLTQLLPAMLFDFTMFLVGQKSGLLRLQRRIYNNLNTFKFFLLNSWTFKNANLRKMLDSLSTEDREEFEFDARKINYEEYIDIWTLGVRRYMMGQDDKSIPKAKENYNRLKYLHYALRTSVCWLIIYGFTTFFCNIFPSIEWHQIITMLP